MSLEKRHHYLMAYAHQKRTYIASDIKHHTFHVAGAAMMLLTHSAPPFEADAFTGNEGNRCNDNNEADSSGYDGRFDDDGHGGGFGHTP